MDYDNRYNTHNNSCLIKNSSSYKEHNNVNNFFNFEIARNEEKQVQNGNSYLLVVGDLGKRMKNEGYLSCT